MSAEATAGELTTEHYGLAVSFQPPKREDGFLPPVRTVVCDEIRRWVHQGQRQVEIIDLTPHGSFRGTGHHITADTPVRIGDRVRKARKRPWGIGALKPGEQWPTADVVGQEGEQR